MKNFLWNLPTQIVFGKDTEAQIGQMVKARGGSKVLILCDSFLKGSTLLDTVTKSLSENGIEYLVQADVAPNPMLTDIEKRIEVAKNEKVNFIISIGGGSTIDTGKAVGVGTASPEIPFEDFVVKHLPITKTIPLGVVLTIAAAGSETSASCMVTLDKGDLHVKGAIAGPAIRAAFAIMNPENLYTLPKFQLGCGTADIMIHTMDRYFTQVDGNEITDEIAESIVRVAAKNGAEAMKTEKNYDALSEVMWCGSLSHNGMTNLGRPMDFSVHQIGNAFSGIYKKATHGAVMAILWPEWAKYVYKNDIPRFARLARKVWDIDEKDDETAALKGINRTKEFFTEELELPSQLRDLGVLEEDLAQIAASVTGNDSRKVGQLVGLSTSDILNIYKNAL